MKLWVVMLQFGSGPRCSIEKTETEAEAVACFAAACLRNGASLPLMMAHTAELSRDRLSELLNGEAAAVYPPAKRPVLPASGLAAAMRGYGPATIPNATRAARAAAERTLFEFLDQYGVDIDFGNGKA